MTITNADAIAKIFTMDTNQLNDVIEAVKMRRTQLSRQATRALRIGDRVSFKGRRNETVRGVVEKVNRKTVSVRSSATGTRWRVTASMVNVENELA